jgi:tetratricopeptide (TPR) repeat protein
VLWAVAGLVLFAAGTGIVALRVWPARLLREAEVALERDDPLAARAALDRYLTYWPHDRRALTLEAQTARRLGFYARAERCLTAAEESVGSTGTTQLEWVLLGVQQGDFAGDEDRLKALVSRDGAEAPLVVEALAKGYTAAYRLPEALMTLDWLIGRRPSHVAALRLRGSIRERQRQADAALADFRRAVELAPQDHRAHAALAAALGRQGYTREAIYHGELALEIGPPRPVVRLALARALGDAAEIDEACQQLDLLLEADPEHADGLVERGRLALRQGRPADADPFLARAVKAAPWHRDAQRLYHGVLRELGRSVELAAAQERIAALRDEDALAGRLKLRAQSDAADVDARWQLWQWCMRNGAEDEGVAWLGGILRVMPNHAPTHAALAEYFERCGQPRRAAMHRLYEKDSRVAANR